MGVVARSTRLHRNRPSQRHPRQLPRGALRPTPLRRLYVNALTFLVSRSVISHASRSLHCPPAVLGAGIQPRGARSSMVVVCRYNSGAIAAWPTPPHAPRVRLSRFRRRKKPSRTFVADLGAGQPGFGILFRAGLRWSRRRTLHRPARSRLLPAVEAVLEPAPDCRGGAPGRSGRCSLQHRDGDALRHRARLLRRCRWITDARCWGSRPTDVVPWPHV